MSIETTTANNPQTKSQDEQLDDAIERLIEASRANARASSAAKGDPSADNLNAWSKTLAEVQAASLAMSRIKTRKVA